MYISYGLVKTFAEIFCTTMINSSCQKALHFKASVNFSECTAKWVSCIPFYTFEESARIFSFTVSNEMIKQNVACWTAFHIKFNYLLMHTSVSSSVDQILTHHYAERLLFLRLCFRNAKECARKGNTVHQHLGNSIRIYRYFKYHCIAKKKPLMETAVFFESYQSHSVNESWSMSIYNKKCILMNIMTYKREWQAKGKRHPCALDDAPTMFCLLDCPTIKFQQQNLESFVSFNLNIYDTILVSYPVWLSF